MSDSDTKTPEMQVKSLDVRWPESIGPAVLANNACVVTDGTTVYVMFAQVNPPYVAGQPDEARERFDNLTSVAAIPVAQVAIPLANFRAMTKTFNDHIEKLDKILNP